MIHFSRSENNNGFRSADAMPLILLRDKCVETQRFHVSLVSLWYRITTNTSKHPHSVYEWASKHYFSLIGIARHYVTDVETY
jgi:hypothetical protein